MYHCFPNRTTNNCQVFILLICKNVNSMPNDACWFSGMIWERNGTVAKWTGGGDFETEYHIVWVASGCDVNMYYCNWYTGQPGGRFTKNHIEIWTKTPSGDIYWTDLNCYNSRSYVYCFLTGCYVSVF